MHDEVKIFPGETDSVGKSHRMCHIVQAILWWPVILTLSCVGVQETDNRGTVFRYNESKGIATLDPAFARNQTIIWPVNQLYNGLVQMDPQLRVVACIARSWEISGDGLQYTFYLRQDVYFHDDPVFPGGEGRKVTAHDFVYSFSRILDPQVASPGAWIFHLVRPENGFEALNDSTFRITLQQPFPAFMGILTMPYCSVVPEEAVNFYGEGFRNHPVGTGPFRFRMWKEGEKLVLRKNEKYFETDSAGEKLPYLDAVAITFISDKQSEFLEFMKGNLDFLSGVHAAYKSELLTRSGKLNPKYAGTIRLTVAPYLNTEYLGFLVDSGMPAASTPLQDVRIRKAINYGIDRQKMITYLRNGLGRPAAAGFVPDGIPAFSEEVRGYTYRPDLSRQLLKEAGYPQGEGLPEIILTTTSDYLDLCEYIQHELSQLGIRIAIEVSTGAAFRNNVANGKLAFFRGSWIADYPDAENYLALFCSKNFSPAGPNYTRYRSPVYDSLYEEALAETEHDRRTELYHRMDQIIIDEAVVVPLFYDRVVRFTPVFVKGLVTNPMNLLELKYTRIEKEDSP